MEDLVAGIAQGNAPAEDRLVRMFEPRIRTMALVRTRNAEISRDLAQEILMAAIEALRRGSLREADKLVPFILGISRNIINNYFRSRDPEPVREPVDTDLIWEAFEGEDDHDRRNAVRHEIDLLDPVDRQILTLTLLENIKPGEIAVRLGISGDVVRQRKVRAIRRISVRLSQTGIVPPQNK